jgi:hypothetical protein
MLNNRELRRGEKIGLHCETTPQLTMQIESLLKFARFGGANERPRFVIYYQKDNDNTNALFERDVCDMPGVNDWSFSFTPLGDTTSEAVSFQNFKDFVRRIK